MIVHLGILIDDADLDAESEPFVKDAGYDIYILGWLLSFGSVLYLIYNWSYLC